MEEQSNTPKHSAITKKEVRTALKAFSPLERLCFILAVTVGAIAVISLLYRINENFLVSIPTQGGTLSEGIIGTPRFVNPLLATSDADKDISALVYRGLMMKNSDGELVPDLAESYNVSSDGLTYTFTLKNVYFQDGQKITADDILFTIKSAQDQTLKSAERVKWEGVTVKSIDAKTISFTLKQQYSPFLGNTTLGILPKHIWEKISYENWIYSDYNTKNVIGDGLYKIKNISQNSSGLPDYYELFSVKLSDQNSPLIDTIKIHFYSSEDSLVSAYKNGDIDTLGGISPENAKKLSDKGAQILKAPLPRVFGLFFNQGQAKIFTDPSVRKAISVAINKNAIVNNVLLSYGQTDNEPIPENTNLIDTPDDSPLSSGNITGAKNILEKAGWKLDASGIYTKQVSKKETDRLSFEIATNDTPELTAAVNLISGDLKKVGIEAIPKVYETGSLNQDIIRPRKFQALFFGEVVSSQSDLYAFWHSSQRNDPGLNISGYANPKTDKLLEQGLATIDTDKQKQIYSSFENEINTDIPAVFVYSPSYIYVVRQGLYGITLGQITTAQDRWNGVTSWYFDTDRVWKIFAPKN